MWCHVNPLDWTKPGKLEVTRQKPCSHYKALWNNYFWWIPELVQKQSFPLCFLFLKVWNQKTKHPFEGNQKIRNKENKKNKTLRWNHFPVQKIVFLFFWFQRSFLKSGNFVCFVTKSRNSASSSSTFVNTWFLIWIKYIIETYVFTCLLQCFCICLTFGYSDWK